MPIDMRLLRARFGPEEGDWKPGQPQRRDVAFVFPTPVKTQPPPDDPNGDPIPIAQSVINGFNIGFTGTDHEIFRQEINLSPPSIFPGPGTAVKVTVHFALRDDSGTFDDDYDGFIDVGVIVERE
jgi:hypothetical protein